MKVVFGEADNMFRILAAALAPDAAGEAFVKAFFRANMPDDASARLAAWARGYALPAPLEVRVCADPGELATSLGDADVLVVEQQRVSAELVARAPRLRLVQKYGIDTRSIDLAACRARAIPVKTLLRHANIMVAEHTILLLMALAKRLPRAMAGARAPAREPAGRWAYNWANVQAIGHLYGATVGLIGLGEIGQVVAARLASLEVRLLYTQRRRNPEAEARLGATFVDRDELLGSADFVSIHVPTNDETHHLVGARELALMKPGACLVNTTRSTVDDQALVTALQSGRLAGAALDAFWEEPLSLSHPLHRLDNVLLTPHVAAGTMDFAWIEREFGALLRNLEEAGG